MPAGAPEARPGILATSWKYVAGGAVALLAVVGGYLGFGSDGEPLALSTTPAADASAPPADGPVPSSTPAATTSDALARFRAALPDGIAFAGEFGSDPCDVFDLSGRVEVVPSGAATITQTAGSADFQSNRGGTIGVGRYLVVWAAAATDAQYGEAWLVVIDLSAVEAGASLTESVAVLNVNGDVDSMVPNSEVESAVAAFVAGLGEDGLATVTPEQFAEAMQAAPSACSGALRDQTITQR